MRRVTDFIHQTQIITPEIIRVILSNLLIAPVDLIAGRLNFFDAVEEMVAGERQFLILAPNGQSLFNPKQVSGYNAFMCRLMLLGFRPTYKQAAIFTNWLYKKKSEFPFCDLIMEDGQVLKAPFMSDEMLLEFCNLFVYEPVLTLSAIHKALIVITLDELDRVLDITRNDSPEIRRSIEATYGLTEDINTRGVTHPITYFLYPSITVLGQTTVQKKPVAWDPIANTDHKYAHSNLKAAIKNIIEELGQLLHHHHIATSVSSAVNNTGMQVIAYTENPCVLRIIDNLKAGKILPPLDVDTPVTYELTRMISEAILVHGFSQGTLTQLLNTATPQLAQELVKKTIAFFKIVDKGNGNVNGIMIAQADEEA